MKVSDDENICFVVSRLLFIIYLDPTLNRPSVVLYESNGFNTKTAKNVLY